MNYSSAWFQGDLQGDLTRRSTPRCAARCTAPACSLASRVLEIGCGWGALAEMAAVSFRPR
jgi:cyclopropane-fatty-acyl-phospholipid synthase